MHDDARTAWRWVDRWAAVVDSIQSPADWRTAHRWLWRTWRCLGRAAAAGINETLGLTGPDLIQVDIPHAFAGDLSGASILLININPGWNERLNAKEDAIVRRSEPAAWEFSRQLFTSYPAKVGQMYWWNRCIGVAWRTLNGGPPVGISARVKQQWANEHVAAVELLPLHSNSAGFLRDMSKAGPSAHRLQEMLLRGMRETLMAALRMKVPLTVILSSPGARFVNGIAQSNVWPPIAPLPEGLPVGASAYRLGSTIVVAIPRPLVTKHSALAPDAVAGALRAIMAGDHPTERCS